MILIFIHYILLYLRIASVRPNLNPIRMQFVIFLIVILDCCLGIAPTIDHMKKKYAGKESKPKTERKRKSDGMDMRQFLKKEDDSTLNSTSNSVLNGADVSHLLETIKSTF